MTTAISDDASIPDCLDELNKCIRWERQHQKEHDDWLADSGASDARMQAIVSFWQGRRARLEARLEQLNQRLLS
jgi:hypothetical protein